MAGVDILFRYVGRAVVSTDADVLGYLFSQFPSGYVLQSLPIGKVVGITTIIWGIILITTPACSSFAGIAVNRFLLGSFEAVVNPAFVLIMSIWYTAAEQPLRLEAYYCTNGIATMFGGYVQPIRYMF